VVLLDASAKEVERFSYGSAKGFTIPEGASLSVKNPLGDKSTGSNWCAETQAWAGSQGDRGTPGDNPGCN